MAVTSASHLNMQGADDADDEMVVANNVTNTKGGVGGVTDDGLDAVENGDILPSRDPSVKDEDDASSEIMRVEQQAHEDEANKGTTLGRLVRTLQVVQVLPMLDVTMALAVRRHLFFSFGVVGFGASEYDK